MFQDKDKLINIQAEVKAPALHLLFFPGSQNEEKTNRIRRVVDEQDDVIKVETIPLTAGTKFLYRSLGVENGGYYLVRPDMYVAYRSNRFNAEHVKRFLDRFFLASKN
jgi:hypothetical protein